jgi:hypothetical protein
MLTLNLSNIAVGRAPEDGMSADTIRSERLIIADRMNIPIDSADVPVSVPDSLAHDDNVPRDAKKRTAGIKVAVLSDDPSVCIHYPCPSVAVSLVDEWRPTSSW